MALTTGQVINNRYRIVKLLGQGGFGAVYRAWDMNLNAPVALKENQALAPESVRQFTTEARLLAGLRHRNLPYVIDHFSLPDQGQYLVMEYIEGQDLDTMLQGGMLSEKEVLPWIDQVCDALIFLHSQTPPIIHRDIKPENIKISPQGQVKLVDFGIAKVFKPSQQTTVGARAVTQGFSPPEQYGGGITDVRSDVYALGATLYAALTGKVPLESLQRQIGKQLTKPTRHNPAIAAWLEDVILKAMELDANQRYQTVSDFKGALLAMKPVVQVAPTEYASPAQARTVPQKAEQPIPTRRAQPAEQVPQPFPYQGPQFPAAPTKPKRSSRWTGLAVGAMVVLCLILGAAGAYGAYTWWYAGEEATNTPVVQALVTSTEPLLPTLIPTLTSTLVANTPPTNTVAPLSPTSPPSPTWTLIPSSTATATQNVKATWYPCTGIYPSRLHVGDKAYISYDPPLPNRVRTQPNADSPIVGYLQVGEKMDIIGGPVCSNNWIWWQIRSLDTNITGWTAEGDATAYWLVPIP